MIKKLAPYTKGYRLLMLFAIACSAGEAVLELTLPQVMSDIVDIGIANGDRGYILMAGLKMVIMALLALGCVLMMIPAGSTLSGIGLVVFMLLTAYDTQKLSQMYSYYAGDSELAEKASIYGALTLYLDFINIFLYVVRLLGMNSRRRN